MYLHELFLLSAHSYFIFDFQFTTVAQPEAGGRWAQRVWGPFPHGVQPPSPPPPGAELRAMRNLQLTNTFSKQYRTLIK